jgi:hypothetical protein
MRLVVSGSIEDRRERHAMFGMTEPTVARYSRLADRRDMAFGAVVRLDRTAVEQAKQAAFKIER